MSRPTASMIALAAVLLCCMSSAAVAQVVTTGMRHGGYTYVSNVLGYVNITIDACDIKAAIGVNNTAALDIFFNGKNSNRATGKRTFNDWSVANHTGQPAFDAIMGGKPLDYFSRAFAAAVNASNVDLAMRIIDAIRIKYMLHEWDEAVEKTEEGLTSAATGAPHNLDEAWAILAAPTTCGETHEAAAHMLADALGTNYAGYPLTMLALGQAFSDAAYHAGMNMTEHVKHAYAVVMGQLDVLLSQRALHDAYVANAFQGCGNRAQAAAIGAAMEMTVRDLLVPILNTSAISQANLDRVTRINASANYQPVFTALSAIMSEAGVPDFALGTPNRTWYREYVRC